MTASRPAIIVMAKAPRAGNAKSRLRDVMSDHAVEALASAFFSDTIRLVQKLDIETIIAFAPVAGRSELARLCDDENALTWIGQRGDDLGSRLENALHDAARVGLAPVVFIGTDSPNLPADYIARSFRIGAGKLVLGPTLDGGYYLIGMHRHVPGLFDSVAWSTDRVFEQTLQNARSLGMETETLPGWYDVDTIDDLRRLASDVAKDPLSAPATACWLGTYRHLISSAAANRSSPTDPG